MKKAILFIGLPGSGKTTIVNRDYTEGYTIVSADDIKQGHPDYDPNDPEPLHQWSVKEAERQMNVLSDSGDQICMDSGGVNNSYSLRIISMLKTKGYHITLVYVETPLKICLERNKKRERKVPEQAIIEKSKMLASCLEKQKSVADEYLHIQYRESKKYPLPSLSLASKYIRSIIHPRNRELIYNQQI
jgi:predicted kinase